MKTTNDSGITPFTKAQQDYLVNELKAKGFATAKPYQAGTISVVLPALYSGELARVQDVMKWHNILAWFTPAKGGIRVRFLVDGHKPVLNA
jgi:hypothetical protein